MYGARCACVVCSVCGGGMVCVWCMVCDMGSLWGVQVCIPLYACGVECLMTVKKA